ncbi:hypothetical protein BDZ45DRAFT_728222 [Acephala macrosclerotiorum]|nr:hypothetical protein BDZ45DRAFT_728222 [Acephala macrosclerotiorum]
MEDAECRQGSVLLQYWLYETENSRLTVAEKLEKSKWETGGAEATLNRSCQILSYRVHDLGSSKKQFRRCTNRKAVVAIISVSRRGESFTGDLAGSPDSSLVTGIQGFLKLKGSQKETEITNGHRTWTEVHFSKRSEAILCLLCSLTVLPHMG